MLGSWILLALFFGRVLAQFVQSRWTVSFLPAFELWQGSNLPYAWLLASQITILVLMCWVTLRLERGQLAPRHGLGLALLAIGSLYLAGMTVRLFLGLTWMAHQPWFAKPLPAAFHMVLACYILLLGHFHWRRGQKGNPTC